MSYHNERRGEGAGAIAARSVPHRSARAPIVSRLQGMQYALGDTYCGCKDIHGRPITAATFQQCQCQPAAIGPGVRAAMMPARQLRTGMPAPKFPGRPQKGSGMPGQQVSPGGGQVGGGGGTYGTNPGWHNPPGSGSGGGSSSGGGGSSGGFTGGSSGFTGGGAPGGETTVVTPVTGSISSTSAPPQILTAGMTCPDGTVVTSIDQCNGSSADTIDLSYLDASAMPDTSSPNVTAVVPVTTVVQPAPSKKFPWLLVGGGLALLYLASRK